jgi:outer membrane biosynthesis protein TonB
LYINNGEDEVEFSNTYKKKSIVPMIDNPLVFKRKEKIDEIPEPEQEVQKIQSMPLNISLSQNPKRRGRPKKNNSPTATPTDITVNQPVTRSRGLMTTKKVSGKTS